MAGKADWSDWDGDEPATIDPKIGRLLMGVEAVLYA